MTLVVDASVVAKWVLAEEGSDRANALRSEDDLIAPALISAEIGNVLWKATFANVIVSDDAIRAIRTVLIPFSRIVAIDELRERALDIAIALQHPIYDCFYLALAERERVPLITADKRLLAATKRMKGVTVKALA